MQDFKRRFVLPSQSLSLERAKVLDEKSTLAQDNIMNLEVSESFNVHAYRQPIRTEGIGIPLPYRHGQTDELRGEVEGILELDSVQMVQEYQTNIRKTVAKHVNTKCLNIKNDNFTWFQIRKERYLENQSKSNTGKSNQKTLDIIATINARSEYYTIHCDAGRHFLYCDVGLTSNHDDKDTSDNLGDKLAVQPDEKILHMCEGGNKDYTPFRINHDIIRNADDYFDTHTVLQDLDLDNNSNSSMLYSPKSQPNMTMMCRRTNSDLVASTNKPTYKTIWLRCEPFVIHVACRSLVAAEELMRTSRPIFENVSIIRWKQKDSLVGASMRSLQSEISTNDDIEFNDRECIIAIEGGDHVNMPLFVLSHDNGEECSGQKWRIRTELFRGHEKLIQNLINERLACNWAKIDQFREQLDNMPSLPTDD